MGGTLSLSVYTGLEPWFRLTNVPLLRTVLSQELLTAQVKRLLLGQRWRLQI